MAALKLIDEILSAFDNVVEGVNNTNTNEDISGININIYSLKCLSKWVRNIESPQPKLTQLDFEKIKQDIQKNVVGNEDVIKLFFTNDDSGYYTNKNQVIINKQIWSNYHSIIHYILSDKSLLIPSSKPDVTNKESKINKLIKLNGDESLSIIIKQSISILKLILIETKIIKLSDVYMNNTTFWWSIYEIIKDKLVVMFDKEKEYYIINII